MKAARRIAIAITIAVVATIAFVVTPAVVPALPSPAAHAADPTGFDPGMIISDEVFYNSGSMNAGQIQSFLTSKGANCRANTLPCLKDFTLAWSERPADAYCRVLPAGSGSAATYFATVAASCGINPQVLLVLVEKEQSLVSRLSPTDYAYRHATGFACPDSGGCSDASAGFATQVYLAAKQYQRYRLNPTSFRHQAGATNQVLYHPDAARCGSSPVYIRNQATAGLYNYTPYQPNAAALNNLYGYGDSCSSYGNRNFWSMFTDWFGNTGSLVSGASFEGNTNGWLFSSGLDRKVIGPTDGAHTGRHFLQMYTPRPNTSIFQDVRLNTQVRDTYTVSIWARSGSAGPHTAALTLWALGGRTEVAQTVFTVGSTWTEIKVSLPIAETGHTGLRIEVYLQSPTAMLDLDDVSVAKTTTPPPVASASLVSPSFEEGMGNWAAKNGVPTYAVTDVGAGAHGGTRVLTASTPAVARSVGQDLRISALRGESYTATIWARTTDPAATAQITMALWGFGSGPTDVGAAVVTVGGTWTPIAASTTVAQASISSMRFEIYLMTAGVEIQFDDASLVPNLAGNPSFEQSTTLWNNGLSGAVLSRIAGTPAIPAVDGQYLATTGTRFGTGSIATDVFRRTSAGETYTATLWLRSAVPGDTWQGGVALWGLGGGDELAVVDVSIPDTWTLVTVTLPTNVAHTALRLEIYNGSPGEVLYVDAAIIR